MLASLLGAGYGRGVKEHVHSDATKPSLPYCLACERLTESAERMHCPGCGSLYHPACAQRLSGCRTPGCAHAPTNQPKVVAARRGGVETLCPYCRTATDEEAVACAMCEATYHPHCAWDLKTCATLGCSGKLRGHVIARRPLGSRLAHARKRFSRVLGREPRYGNGPPRAPLPGDGAVLKTFLLAQVPTFLLVWLVAKLAPSRGWEQVGTVVTWLLGGVLLPLVGGAVLARRINARAREAEAREGDEGEDGVTHRP